MFCRFIGEFCRDQNELMGIEPTMNIPRPCRDYNRTQCKDKQCRYPHLCYRFVDESRDNFPARRSSCLNCGKDHILSPSEKAKLAPYCFDIKSYCVLKLYLEVMQRFIKPGASSTYRKSVQNYGNGLGLSVNGASNSRPESSNGGYQNQDSQVQDMGLEVKKENENEESEICWAFLKNKCAYGDTCFKVHPAYKTTVLWEFKPMGQKVWRPFEEEESEALESRFCVPEIDRGTYPGMKLRVMYDFETMKCTLYPPMPSKKIVCNIRRTETKEKRTKWNFYWQNEKENGFWQPYAKNGNFGLDCDEIDQIFEKLQTNEFTDKFFLVNNSEGRVLHLKKAAGNFSFYETDVSGHDRKEVKRRPREEKIKINEKGVKASKTHSEISAPSVNEAAQKVCAKHETKPCTKRECPMFGCTNDFLWLYKEKSRKQWNPFPENVSEFLESQFCNPEISETKFKWNNQEERIRFGDHEIELISKPSFDVLRLSYGSIMSWAWYWLENASNTRNSARVTSLFPEILQRNGIQVRTSVPKNWKLYGEKGSRDVASDIESDRIEYGFESYRDEKIKFLAGKSIYEINFTTFDQKNLKSGSVRKIRRRPKIDIQKQEPVVDQQMVFDQSPPKEWVSKSRSAFIAVEPEDNIDCNIITSFFKDAIDGYDVIVTRIENHKIWKNYHEKKKEMITKLGQNGLNEVLLLHETEKKYKNEIMESNTYKVGPRKTMSNIGKGIYFTNEIDLTSIPELEDDSEESKFIFVSLVLAGEYTQGSKFFVRPPLKENELSIGEEQYDSCVDDPYAPKVVALFDVSQTYPLYMVELQPEE